MGVVLHPPTRGEQRLRALGYLFVALIGAYTVLYPSSLMGHLGFWGIVWGAFMFTALPCAVAVLIGRWRAEAVLLPLFGSAFVIAILNVLIRIFDGEPDDASLVPRALTALALMCSLAVRSLQLHRILKAEPWITTELSR
jgi:uncharacterized PurR-regulated membrane protein YhhQ (DUF165 family)